MGRNTVRLITLVMSLLFVSTGHAAIRARIVTELDKAELYDANLFHARKLWVGRSRRNGNAYYQLQVFDATGAAIDSRLLSHSVTAIYPASPTEVLILGRAITSGWLVSHYLHTYITRASIQNNRLVIRTTDVTTDYVFDTLGVEPGNSRQFLGETGSAAIYAYRPPRGIQRSAGVVAPGQLFLVGNALLALERNSIYPGDENLVKIDLTTNTVTRAFSRTQLRNLTRGMVLNTRGRLAFSAQHDDLVHLFDIGLNQLSESIPIPGGPRGLAQLGHCLVVLSEGSRELRFVDLRDPDRRVVSTWPLPTLENKLQYPTSVQVDPATGAVFVRSNHVCQECQTTPNSVVRLIETTDGTRSACDR